MAPFADRLARLTPRERQVFDGLVDGLLSKEIAFAFGTSVRSVEVQRARVLEKMRARNSVTLAREAGWHFGPAD